LRSKNAPCIREAEALVTAILIEIKNASMITQNPSIWFRGETQVQNSFHLLIHPPKCFRCQLNRAVALEAHDSNLIKKSNPAPETYKI